MSLVLDVYVGYWGSLIESWVDLLERSQKDKENDIRTTSIEG